MQKNQILSPHFSLLEFTESATARKRGIANEATPEVVDNLTRLCHHTMEPLREALGLPVIITSGYRSKPLNDIIAHHSHRSQHLQGCACEFYVGGDDTTGSKCNVLGAGCRGRLIKAFRLILTSESIDFDQLILYPNFIHVSYVSPRANRHYIMVGDGNGKYRRVSHETALTLV